jgi:hypothetical protein
MRDFRDAKAMARSLRAALKARAVETTHSESLELISRAFGSENWNVLSAQIETANVPSTDQRPLPPVEAQHDPSPPTILYCSFCGKSPHEVRKLIKGPGVFICDECVDLCTEIVEPDDDKEFFRLIQGTGGSEGRAEPVMFNLAREASTEELANCVERGRKGVERNPLALNGIQRRLGAGDDVPASDKTREELAPFPASRCGVSCGTKWPDDTNQSRPPVRQDLVGDVDCLGGFVFDAHQIGQLGAHL